MDCQKNAANNIKMAVKQYVKKKKEKKTLTVQFVKRKQLMQKLGK